MTAVPATRTFVAGEVVLASYFNTNIRDVLNYLLAPPVLECYQSTTQTLTTATFTAILMQSEEVDSSGMHSTVSNTSRGTAVYPGYYRVSGSVSYASNTNNQRFASLYKNGAASASGAVNANALAGALQHDMPTKTKLVFHNVTDYSEIFGWQNTGGNLATFASAAEASTLSMKWESN